MCGPVRIARATHGEHYTGEARSTQGKTYKKPDFARLPAMLLLEYECAILFAPTLQGV
jgi:hypothetical protein